MGVALECKVTELVKVFNEVDLRCAGCWVGYVTLTRRPPARMQAQESERTVSPRFSRSPLRRGREAALILLPALRTRKFTVRLPLYQIGALQALADDGGESVDVMVMRMIEEVAELNKERLSLRVAGLVEAMECRSIAADASNDTL